MGFLDKLRELVTGETTVQSNRAKIDRQMQPLIKKANERNVQKLRSGQINREQYQQKSNEIFNQSRPQVRSLGNGMVANNYKDSPFRTINTGLASGVMNIAPQRILGSIAEYGGTAFGNDSVRDFGTRLNQPFRDFNAVNQEQASNKGLYTGANVVGGLLTLPIAPVKGTGAFRATQYGASSAADTAYAIKQGGGDQRAQVLGGGVMGGVSGYLGARGADKILNPTNKLAASLPGRIAQAGLYEGLEEATESGVQSGIAKTTYDKDLSLKDAAKDAALSFAIGGAFGGALRGGVELGRNPKVQDTAKQTATQVQDKAKPLGATSAQVKADPQYRQFEKRITKAIKNASESTGKLKANYLQEARELIRLRNARVNELTQGGFIGGGKATGFNQAQEQGRVFEGVDGKPRFEVDDSGAYIKQKGLQKALGMNGNTKAPIPLDQLLSHKELFSQYPQLRKVKVLVGAQKSQGKYDKFIPATRGEYNPATNTIVLSGDKATLLHEVQHAIQQIEGFSTGATSQSPEMIKSTIDRIKTQLKQANEKLSSIEKGTNGYREALDNRNNLVKALDNYQDQYGRPLSAEKAYKNNAGEAEARAVASRMNMSDGERYKIPKTADDYAMSHRPDPEGATLDDISQGGNFVPEDVYTNPEWYGDVSDQATRESIATIQKVKGNPEAEVTVYRASPKNELNSGDWISLSKKYAVGESGVEGTKVHSFKVKAKELRWPGDSFNEFGYFPDSKPQSTFYDSLDVPKEDLIIRDGSGKAMSVEQPSLVGKHKGLGFDIYNGIPDGWAVVDGGAPSGYTAIRNTKLPALERRTALVPDVNTRTWYHGTNSEFDKFDKSKIGTTTDEGIFGSGFYFSSDRKTASQAPRGGSSIVKESTVSVKNPLDLSKFKTKKELANYLDMDESSFVGGEDGRFVRPSNNLIRQFTSHVKEAGHDGVLVKHTLNGARGDELVVFEPDLINGVPGKAMSVEPDSVAKYGWKSETVNGETKLYNRNNKHVATIAERKGRFTASYPDGQRIATGGDLNKLADDVAKKNFYATEIKPDSTGGTLRPDKIPEPYTNPAIQSELSSERAKVIQSNTDKMKSALEFDKKPTPKTAFHSTASLDIENGKLRASSDGAMGGGVYLHTDQNTAREAGAMQGDGNIADQTALNVNLKTDNLYKWSDTNYPTPEQVALIKKRGYDGIYKKGGEIVVFSPDNVQLNPKRSQLSGKQLDVPNSALKPSSEDAGNLLLETDKDIGQFTNQDAEMQPDFDAYSTGRKNETKQLTEQLTKDYKLTQAVRKAQLEGEQLNFFAKKDKGGRSVGIEPFDPKRHTIEAGFVRDENGNILGNHIRVDETGISVNVAGQEVNVENIIGDPLDWDGNYRMMETMDRNLKRLAPNEKAYRRTRRFLIDHKTKQEAVFREELATERKKLQTRSKDVMNSRPSKVGKEEYKSDIFDFIEGNMSRQKLGTKYDTATINKIVQYKKDTRKLYDGLLERVNQEFTRFGEPTVDKRKDYITHINELMNKPSFAGEMYGRLQNSFLGEGQQTTRGAVPANIAGRTEGFEPRKKWNKFFQRRKGGDFIKDPFAAVDAYLEPTLYNIHMTESAVRARAVEATFRTAEEIRQWDKKGLQESFSEELDKYKDGDNSKLVTGVQEYANALAGKTQRWDRQIVDSSQAGATGLRAWQTLQKYGGRATVLANASSVVSQSLNQPLAIADTGIKNYVKAIGASLSGKSPIDKSPFIKARSTDVASTFRSKFEKTLDAMGVPLQKVELFFVKHTWNAEYQKALDDGYKGKEAILEADRRTEQVVAGRGIADRPEAYRSTVANGFLQYTLEVSATNKKFFQDLNTEQKVKFIGATYIMNSLVGLVTGFEPLPDFLDAALKSVEDFGDEEDERSIGEKAVGTAQRFAGEAISMNPLATATVNTALDQNQRKSLFGEDADVGRFEGTAAPIQYVRNAYRAGDSFIKGIGAEDEQERNGRLLDARNSALKLLPGGNQARKTATGTEMNNRGYAIDRAGNPTYAAPDNALGQAQAAIFGTSSTKGAREYYDGNGRNITGKADTQAIKDSGNPRETVNQIQQRRGTKSEGTSPISDGDIDKYDTILKAFKKKDGELGYLQDYDNEELKTTIKDVANEGKKSIFSDNKLPVVEGMKFDSRFARDYASYRKSIEGKDLLTVEKKTQEFARNTYKDTMLSTDTMKPFYKLGDDDMRYELQQGTLTKEQMDKVIELDNLLTSEGLQKYPQVGKILRRELGYGQIESGSGKSSYARRGRSKSSGGSRRKYSFNIPGGFSLLPEGSASSAGSVRNLLANSRVDYRA